MKQRLTGRFSTTQRHGSAMTLWPRAAAAANKRAKGNRPLRTGTGTETGEEKEVPISIKDITSNPRSYVPKSLDDLKTNKKAQVGVAGLMMLCLILLLLVMVSGGGISTSTDITPRRFRR